MALTKGKKSKSKKKKKKARDADSVAVNRDTISRKINKTATIDAADMKTTGREFRMAYKNESLVTGRVREAKSMESDVFKLNAIRYVDGDGQKLLIKDLGNITDPEYGNVDRINAILTKAEFDTDQAVQIFLTTDTEEATRNLRENIEKAEPELLDRITFVRAIDPTAGRQAQENDDADDNQQADNVRADNFAAPKSIVIDAEQLAIKMGEDPKKNFLFIQRSEKYKTVIERLNNYHENIDAYKSDLANGKDTAGNYEKANKDMRESTVALIEAIDAYTATSKTKESSAVKDAKKDVMQTLKDQLHLNLKERDTLDLNNPIKYINKDIEAIRMEHLIKVYNPLLDSQLTNAPEVARGEGAQGSVSSKIYRLQDNLGRPMDFEAIIKIDDSSLYNENGGALGIPNNDPEQSKRSVTTYQINNVLGMEVIPRTEYIMRRNDKGDLEFGQAMQLVNGSESQKEVKIKDYSPEEASELVDGAKRGSKPIGNIRVNIAENKAWTFNPTVVNADTKNAELQKGLSNLQLLDNIIGNADRNFGNIMIEFTGEGDQKVIKGVKGIDNDESFAVNWASTQNPFIDDGGFPVASKTQGMPPVIDVRTALNLINLNVVTFSQMHFAMKDSLNGNEIQKTMDRLDGVRNSVVEMVRTGKFAQSADTENPVTDKEFRILADISGKSVPALQLMMKTWGGQEIEKLHAPDNSYLGDMKQRIKDEDAVDF